MVKTVISAEKEGLLGLINQFSALKAAIQGRSWIQTGPEGEHGPQEERRGSRNKFPLLQDTRPSRFSSVHVSFAIQIRCPAALDKVIEKEPFKPTACTELERTRFWALHKI